LVSAGRVCVSLPPLYRIDVGKHVFYAVDDAEKEAVLESIRKEKLRGSVNVQRFKGLGEMNPSQLRETTMDPASRRLIELTLDSGHRTDNMLDLLLARKRAPDRKVWLAKDWRPGRGCLSDTRRLCEPWCFLPQGLFAGG